MEFTILLRQKKYNIGRKYKENCKKENNKKEERRNKKIYYLGKNHKWICNG